MKLPKKFAAWSEVQFLLVLSDGRERGFMEITQKLNLMVSPTSQLFISKLAAPLCQRGLVKGSGGIAYKITDAGLVWLEREGLEVFRQAFNLPADYIESLGPDRLAALRKLARM